MTSNSRLDSLKQIFWNKENKKENRMREILKRKKEEHKEIKLEELNLDLPKTFKSEFNFLKFPFFDLTPRVSKKDRIEIKEVEETKDEKIEILWQVSRNIDSDFPSSFARRVHKEVVEETLNNTKRPISRLIRLGSLRQICKEMNISPSGGNCKEIKKALENIKSAKIKTKGTFCSKAQNKKKYYEGIFSLYDTVFFTGETLPDGTEADAVYILLNDMYVKNFNYNYVVPLDYQYYQSLNGDISSRMYEILSIWFYPALESGKKYIEKKYSELCSYFPLIRQDKKWKAKKQLKVAHQQHILDGFLALEPEWINISKKDDWSIRYWIGSRAQDWHKSHKKLGAANENVKQIAEPISNRVEETIFKSPLINKLTDIGITENVAIDLIKHINPEIIHDWIQAIPETNAEDKAAFLVKAIKEKWELPGIFKKKKKEQVQKRHDKRREILKNQYSQYIDNELKPFLNKEELENHRNIFLEKYPFYKRFDKNPELLTTFIKNDYRSTKIQELGLPSLEIWQKTIHKTL
jgi:hypothetical protein